jgi:hypothetical protein
MHEASERQFTAPDGTFRAYSPRLISTLEAAGCKPLVRHRNGEATFHMTGTVRRVIEEYIASSRVEKRASKTRRRDAVGQ